jgi:hypothetical protein
MEKEIKTANKLKALEIALKLIEARSIVKFDETLPNVEALTQLVLTWAETGTTIVEQIQAMQQKAIEVKVVEPEQDNTPANGPTYG